MKIKCVNKTYEQVMALPRPKHRKPLRPMFLLQSIVRVGSLPTLWKTRFSHTRERMDEVWDKPCLILMNHSSFTDMKLASAIFYPKPYGIVCTTDAFVGLDPILRLLGCIPTQKFVSDLTLIKDMEYMLKEKKVSVLMYPEAGYSFDGTATTMPRKMGILLKKLGVPVVTVITHGAFARDPLYNCLQIRKVKVSAEVKCLFTEEEVKSLSVAELDKKLEEVFTFDNFAWQQENKVAVKEPFRADGLERVLYKCPHCGTEGKMEGKGIALTCHHCGKTWELTQYGKLECKDGDPIFDHVPNWYAWERAEVRKELEEGAYQLDTAVDIGMLVDTKALYMVGTGKLHHDENGFTLRGDDGKLRYDQGPLAAHSLNADYYWYEIGDVISIGDRENLYYCFPKEPIPVAKARLATEELYKMKKTCRARGRKTV